MNIDTFRSRMAQSAQAAASAARQFSSLDEMAQNDHYVHSEGLNVSNKKKAADGRVLLTESSSVVENLSDKFVDAISTAAKPKSQSRNEAAPAKLVAPKGAKEHVVSAHKPKLVSSVAALYEQEANSSNRISGQETKSGRNNIKSKSCEEPSYNRKKSSEPTGVIVGNMHAHILHQLHYESDDSSVEEREISSLDDMGDLELAKKTSPSDELERELTETLQHERAVEKKKDPHRFMAMTADYEEQETLLPIYSGSANQKTPKAELNAKNVPEMPVYSQSTTAGQETRNAFNVGLTWVKNIASPQLQAISKQIMTKVTENEGRYFPTQDKDEQLSSKPIIGPRQNKSKATDIDDDIIMTSSATFLADDDMAELERIRSKHSSSQLTVLVRTCLESLWESPRLAFVAATFIFAVLVYYYSRKRSVDDVL